MRHSRPVRLKTAPTGFGLKTVRLESRYIPDTSGQAGQARTYRVWLEDGAVANRTYQGGKAVKNCTYPDNKFIPIYRGDRSRPGPIISLQVPIYRDARRVGIYPEHRGFIGDESGLATTPLNCGNHRD